MKRAFVVVGLLGVLAGCLTHVPDRDPKHLLIRWQPDFESACREAAASSRPILLCMIAGDLTEPC